MFSRLVVRARMQGVWVQTHTGEGRVRVWGSPALHSSTSLQANGWRGTITISSLFHTRPEYVIVIRKLRLGSFPKTSYLSE